MGTSRDPELWHPGKVLYGKFLSNNIRLWEMELKQLEGKEVEMLIREKKERKSSSQLALYFGVIIKKYCMPDEQFGGWDEWDIDQYFRWELTKHNKTVKDQTFLAVDDIRTYTKEQMTIFIEGVLNILAEMNIYIDDPEQFKLNKYLKE